MANDIKVCGASAMPRHQTCELHNDERKTKCSGTLRRGGICTNKAKGPSAPGVMPTCYIHRDQLKVPTWCKALLPCGFECGRLLEWKPHGFQLCPSHLEDSMACYFFKIPIEIRCRIYRFLLPDGAIPARFKNSRHLTTDWGQVYTAILCVNHQIHEEAANLLYCARVFTIEVSENTLSMCNLPNKCVEYVRHGSPQCGYALQDQLQLMPLDQQYKALRSRQNQDNSNGESSSIHTPVTSPPAIGHKPVEPVWDPPLSERYFTMIQSFRIELLFHYPISYTPYKPPGSSTSGTDKRKVLRLRLSCYCDQLHRLIGRLRLRERPIAHLEIVIKFSNTYIQPSSFPAPMEAYSAARFLLNPFRRLCKVAKPQVLSITINDFPTREMELLCPDRISSPARRAFANYLGCWSKDLSSSQPSFKCDQVLEAYWRLESLLSSIQQHWKAEPRIFQFAGLLHAARIAREANSLESFREIRDLVRTIWFEHLDDQKVFQSNVMQSIDAIDGIIEKGS